MATGQGASWSAPWPTEPSRMPRTPPRRAERPGLGNPALHGDARMLLLQVVQQGLRVLLQLMLPAPSRGTIGQGADGQQRSRPQGGFLEREPQRGQGAGRRADARHHGAGRSPPAGRQCPRSTTTRPAE